LAQAFTNDEEELRKKQDKQRQLQAETDRVVRRLNTIMQVMQFYEVEHRDKKIMEEMSRTLSHLSKEQMTQIIAEFEKAAQAARTKNVKVSEEAQDKATETQQRVIRTLHELVALHHAIKSLEQAADMFEKHARDQLDLQSQSDQSLRDLIEIDNPETPATVKVQIASRNHTQGTVMKSQGNSQSNLELKVSLLINQVKKIDKLSPEHQERVKKMEQEVRNHPLSENMLRAADKLKTLGFPSHRIDQFKIANTLQGQSSKQLQKLASLLRPLSDLEQAREKIDQAIARQEAIAQQRKENEDKNKEEQAKNAAEKDPKEKLELPGLKPLPNPKTAAKKEQAKAIQNAQTAQKNAERRQEQRGTGE